MSDEPLYGDGYWKEYLNELAYEEHVKAEYKRTHKEAV